MTAARLPPATISSAASTVAVSAQTAGPRAYRLDTTAIVHIRLPGDCNSVTFGWLWLDATSQTMRPTLRAVGGGSADQFVARGPLRATVAEAVAFGTIRLHERFPVRAISEVDDRLEPVSNGRQLGGSTRSSWRLGNAPVAP